MNYTSPPLPFMGNKNRWVKQLVEEFKNIKFNSNVVIVDLFGGSGILSHVFASMYPNNQVIYNDYDNYLSTFKLIPSINKFLDWARQFLNNKGYKQKEKISDSDKHEIINKLKYIFGANFEKNDKLVNIICSSLCFNGHISINGTLYNNIRTRNFDEVKLSDYILPNIKVVHYEFETLVKKLKEERKNVFYILDPPYLSTSKDYYKNDKYWGIEKTIAILKICFKYKCILFESDKSELLPLIYMICEIAKLKINMDISEYKQLSGQSESNDYYILFNM